MYQWNLHPATYIHAMDVSDFFFLQIHGCFTVRILQKNCMLQERLLLLGVSLEGLLHLPYVPSVSTSAFTDALCCSDSR